MWQRLYPTESAKHLGVKIDTNLSWKCYVHDHSVILTGEIAFLFKIRIYVKIDPNVKIHPFLLLFYPTYHVLISGLGSES